MFHLGLNLANYSVQRRRRDGFVLNWNWVCSKVELPVFQSDPTAGTIIQVRPFVG